MVRGDIPVLDFPAVLVEEFTGTAGFIHVLIKFPS
jgi:hypothetical protein